MRERFHILYQTVLLLIVAAVLLTACSSDSSEAQTNPAGKDPVDHVVNIVPFATSYMEQASGHRAAPTGYSDYVPVNGTQMGIYMLLPEDYPDPTEQIIKYSGARWHAYFSVEKNKTYTVYGYLPKTSGMSSSLTKTTADAAMLTITGMKPVTTDDICIITGVKETETGLKEGQFSWNTPIGDETYFMYLLLNHLYASVRFSMKIDEEYALLRTIKLKSMTLSTNKGSVVSAEISLTHNTTGAIPITNVTYTETGTSSEADIFSDDEGMTLETTPMAIDACFAPSLSNDLTLVSTYDVYDSQDNLIRRGCTSTNKIPALNAKRGERVQINLAVNPTYLYVLSHKDLNNLFVIE